MYLRVSVYYVQWICGSGRSTRKEHEERQRRKTRGDKAVDHLDSTDPVRNSFSALVIRAWRGLV